MKKLHILFSAGILLAFNILCWNQVFILAGNSSLKVVFFDVGQGDAVFIETPEGHQIIIDGGPDSSLLQKLNERMPFWDRTIDLVVLTHPEKDHMTGLLSLLERYKVDYFLWTGVVKNDAQNRKLAEILDKIQKPAPAKFFAGLSGFLPYGKKPLTAKIVTVIAGDKIKTESLLIDILHPFENLSGQEPKNTNDTSVVLRVIFGKSEFLFTGDIGFSVESKLASKFGLSSDILKVAHHGSKYSTSNDFLSAVGPDIAVISVGKNNSYGHPTQEVLQRLAVHNAEVLRTDQKGDITILSDGEKIYIK